MLYSCSNCFSIILLLFSVCDPGIPCIQVCSLVCRLPSADSTKTSRWFITPARNTWGAGCWTRQCTASGEVVLLICSVSHDTWVFDQWWPAYLVRHHAWRIASSVWIEQASGTVLPEAWLQVSQDEKWCPSKTSLGPTVFRGPRNFEPSRGI